MSEKQYNVAVIGFGLSAKIFHIPFILAVPSLKLHSIVQRHPKPHDDARKIHQGVKVYRSSEEMVQDDEVDVVVVTSIPDTHFYLTKLALEHGKHVVCEKPFVPTSKEADELIALAKEKSRLLTVYQNRRWDSDFATVQKLISSDTFGRIAEFESHFDRHSLGPSRSEWKNQDLPAGGAIFDLGTHLIDQVVHLFGMPQTVTGFLTHQKPGQAQREDDGGDDGGDSFTVVCRYKDGMMATAKAAVCSPEVEQLRYWIRGEKASFKKYHLDCQEPQLISGMRPGDPNYAVEEESHHGMLSTVGEDGKITSKTCPTVDPPTYTEFYRIFADALAGKGHVPVTAEDASKVLKVIELVKESNRTGKNMDVGS